MATPNSSLTQCDNRNESASGQNLQPTAFPFILPFSAAPGSIGIIQWEQWQNLMPIGSTELNGAFHPGRQGCHYPSSRSCTRRSHGLRILTPSVPPAWAERCKGPKSGTDWELKKKRITKKIYKLQGSLRNLSFLACRNRHCLLAFPWDHSMWLWWHGACPGMNFRTTEISQRMSGVG